MGEAKEPTHGQIRVDKDGSTFVAVEQNSLKGDTITPDSIRDKELDELRSKLRREKYRSWGLFILGLIIGAVISWALTMWWG